MSIKRVDEMMQFCSSGFLPTHTCDDVGQAGVKVLQQLTDRVNEEEGVIVTVQQPTVLSFIYLHIVIHSNSFVDLFAHSYLNCLYLAKSPNHRSVHTCMHLYMPPTPMHHTATACKADPRSFRYCK